MEIAVLGATGGTGEQLLRQACAAGHQVMAVVRDPTRVVYEHPLLTVVQANALDPDEIGAVIDGKDAVVTAIGGRSVRQPTTVQTDTTTSIIRAMGKQGLRRLIVVSNSGMITDGDGPATRWLVKPILRRILKHPWADMASMERVVRASDLDWTIVRPPMLTNGPHTGTYRTARDRNVRGSNRVSRADLADCILRCLADQDSLRTAVALAN